MICHFDVCKGLDWRIVRRPVNVSINASGHYSITKARRQSTLTIHNLVEADQGYYYCICNGDRSVCSNGTIIQYPSFENVEPVQDFQIGETATVECDATPGVPPLPLLWFRNDSLVVQSDRLSMDLNGRRLIIRDIRSTDSGLYKCKFHSVDGLMGINITINVMPPDLILTVTRPAPSVRYDDPLTLDCSAEPNDPSLQFSWYNPLSQRIGHNQTTVLPAVMPGSYTCTVNASAYNGKAYDRSVSVSIVNAPPRFKILPQTPIRTDEFESHVLTKKLKLALDDNSNLHFQWKRKGKDVDFSSRLNFTINHTVLTVTIANAQISDSGSYLLNVSNDFGYDLLTVNIGVDQLVRTEVLVQFKSTCDSQVSIDKFEIAAQIADAFACNYCGDVEVEDATFTGCLQDNTDDDQGTLSLRVILTSKVTLPSLATGSVVLDIGGEAVTAMVTLESTQSTPIVVTNPSIQREDNTLVVSIIITLVVTLFVLATVLTLTFVIRKCSRHNCFNDKVGQEEQEIAAPDQEPEVVVHLQPANQNQVECIGYVRVNKTHAIPNNVDPTSNGVDPTSDNIDPTSTPVTLPFPTQPPYITSINGQPCIAPTAGLTPQPKRPAKLFFRSHSYHGSTRTPVT